MDINSGSVAIGASVGAGGVNQADDVQTVLALLVRHQKWVPSMPHALKGGVATTPALPLLVEMIKDFQREACALKEPDGRIDTNGFTLQRLNLPSISGPKHKVFGPMQFCPSSDIPHGAYVNAAKALGCEIEVIKAVGEVEVKIKGPFDVHWDLRPTILFERHWFKHFTNNAYTKTHPDLSGPPGGYGLYKEQYAKLRRAAMLDETAALLSASWGGFQIMGFNFKSAGSRSVEEHVDRHIASVVNHLDMFVAHVKSNSTLLKAIQRKDWAAFAYRYNGQDYHRHDYDGQMARAYKTLKRAAAAASPGVRAHGERDPSGRPRAGTRRQEVHH